MSRTHNQPERVADRQGVLRWLEDFAAAVRDADYDRGRAMFVPDAIGFGTVGRMLDGLDALVEQQWKRVWGVTEGFAFEMDRAVCGAEDDLGWAAAPWSSWGKGSADGSRFRRSGRATFVLRRDAAMWRAVHSHVSLDPRGISPDEA